MNHTRCSNSSDHRSLAGNLLWCAAFVLMLLVPSRSVCGDEDVEKKEEQPAQAEPQVRIISVPLPIAGNVDDSVSQAIQKAHSGMVTNGPRSIFILEFKAAAGQTGEGSQFGDALDLARFLSSDQLKNVRTVAYIPNSLKGHAVLVALACEEIIIAPDAEFGEAGINEPFIDPTVRRGYADIAERRRTLPTPVVLGMLDKQTPVFKVQTQDGVRYALSEELEKLRQTAAVQSVDRIIPEGEMGKFTGRDLRLKLGFASHLAADRNELAAALQVSPQALQNDPSLAGGWRPIRVNLEGPVHAQAVDWILKAIRKEVRDNKANFIAVVIESGGGSLNDSLKLVNLFSDGELANVRTVAYVPHQALADAALIALACDNVIVGENAILGGAGETEFSEEELKQLRVTVADFAQKKGIDWSLPAAMVERNLELHRYSREGTNAVRYLCAEEWEALKDRDSWQRGAQVSAQHGISGRDAEQFKLARFTANNFDEVRRLYNLTEEPRVIQPSWAHVFIQGLAHPKIAGLLLFIAWFALMVEFMTPGFTGAGFLSGICFMLYFWSQFLHGTAGWLEILLFVAGVICVAIEVFAMPGLGIVGIGGGLMIVASIILASQTFVIPQNTYQIEQLPSSLFTIVAAGSGAVLSLALMRRYLPHAPMFNRMMLNPPDPEQAEQISHREALTDFQHLVGQEGVAITPLVPAGKARFGSQLVDVISDGSLVPRGAQVCVKQVVGNRVLVSLAE